MSRKREPSYPVQYIVTAQPALFAKPHGVLTEADSTVFHISAVIARSDVQICRKGLPIRHHSILYIPALILHCQKGLQISRRSVFHIPALISHCQKGPPISRRGVFHIFSEFPRSADSGQDCGIDPQFFQGGNKNQPPSFPWFFLFLRLYSPCRPSFSPGPVCFSAAGSHINTGSRL